MTSWFSGLARDARHSARALTRMPLLSTVVILSLGVGIGVNTVVFSWIQAALLRPLPGVAGAASFYWIEPRTDDGDYVGVSWLEYRDLRARLSTIRDPLAFRMAPLYVGEPGRTERSYGLLVSDDYFASLGLHPSLGRFLLADEVSVPGAAPVVVISHEYWQTRFGGSPQAIGETIRINGARMTIVGVTPQGFQGTVPRLKFDLFLPATLAPVVLPGTRELEERGVRGYAVMGALNGGVSARAAREDVRTAMRELASRYPASNTRITADALAFWDAPRGPQRFMATALVLLQGILLLLLLSVCGNTANLVLARATARHREMGVRLAVGATPSRVVTLLLVENLLLGLAGALCGALIALWGTNAIKAMPPLRVRGLPITFETTVTVGTIVFAAAAGIACGLLAAAPAAFQLARLDPQSAVRIGARSAGRSRIRNGILGVQVGLAVIVLISGGLVLRSFLQTRDEDPGFRRAGVLLAAYDFTGRNQTASSIRSFAARALDAVRAVPGVENVALAASVPLDIHGLPSRVFTVEGHARSDAGYDQALTNTVSPGYFATLDIPLVAGEDFVSLQDAATPPQAIVNQAFVDQFLPGVQPLGRRLESRGRTFVICGVARTTLSNAFGEPPLPVVYFSYRDNPLPTSEMHIRTRPGAETSVAGDVRRAIARLDPELPVYDVRTMSDHIESNLLFRRIPARIFVVVGPLLLVIAALGVYGVVAYAASLRRREIGVRLALGASAARVIRQFVLETLGTVGAAALAGCAAATVLVLDLLKAERLDGVVFVTVPAVLIVVTVIASWLPARRGAALDPASVLRQE